MSTPSLGALFAIHNAWPSVKMSRYDEYSDTSVPEYILYHTEFLDINVCARRVSFQTLVHYIL